MTGKLSGIKVAGHKGTWYSIDRIARNAGGGKLYLMEHETYGEDVDHIIIDEKHNVVLEDVVNGFADLPHYRHLNS